MADSRFFEQKPERRLADKKVYRRRRDISSEPSFSAKSLVKSVRDLFPTFKDIKQMTRELVVRPREIDSLDENKKRIMRNKIRMQVCDALYVFKDLAVATQELSNAIRAGATPKEKEVLYLKELRAYHKLEDKAANDEILWGLNRLKEMKKRDEHTETTTSDEEALDLTKEESVHNLERENFRPELNQESLRKHWQNLKLILEPLESNIASYRTSFLEEHRRILAYYRNDGKDLSEYKQAGEKLVSLYKKFSNTHLEHSDKISQYSKEIKKSFEENNIITKLEKLERSAISSQSANHYKLIKDMFNAFAIANIRLDSNALDLLITAHRNIAKVILPKLENINQGNIDDIENTISNFTENANQLSSTIKDKKYIELINTSLYNIGEIIDNIPKIDEIEKIESMAENPHTSIQKLIDDIDADADIY